LLALAKAGRDLAEGVAIDPIDVREQGFLTDGIARLKSDGAGDGLIREPFAARVLHGHLANAPLDQDDLEHTVGGIDLLVGDDDIDERPVVLAAEENHSPLNRLE